MCHWSNTCRCHLTTVEFREAPVLGCADGFHMLFSDSNGICEQCGTDTATGGDAA